MYINIIYIYIYIYTFIDIETFNSFVQLRGLIQLMFFFSAKVGLTWPKVLNTIFIFYCLTDQPCSSKPQCKNSKNFLFLFHPWPMITY
jgi:hypothetical protein